MKRRIISPSTNANTVADRTLFVVFFVLFISHRFRIIEHIQYSTINKTWQEPTVNVSGVGQKQVKNGSERAMPITPRFLRCTHRQCFRVFFADPASVLSSFHSLFSFILQSMLPNKRGEPLPTGSTIPRLTPYPVTVGAFLCGAARLCPFLRPGTATGRKKKTEIPFRFALTVPPAFGRSGHCRLQFSGAVRKRREDKSFVGNDMFVTFLALLFLY